MERTPEVAYLLVLAIMVASALIVPIGVLLAAPLVQLTRVPTRYLVPIIIVVATLGAYASRNSYVDVTIALIFGLLGIVLRIYKYPIVPLVLGFILAPLIEDNYARANRLANGDWTYYFSTPLSLALWALLGMTLVVAVVKTQRARRRPSTTAPAEEATPEPVGGA
jgi:putative tricarboxylic transport membrane protein